MPRKSKAQCARQQNITFARKHRVTVQEESNIDAPDIRMTGDSPREECEEPACGSEDPEMWDDEFENYGEGILGGVEYWEWSKDNKFSDSDSEYDPEDSPESETESEVGLEDLDFDEEENTQKEAELLAFSEALRKAQVNAVALAKAQMTKKHRGKSTGKSLSTLNRIARANAELAKSGQKCISSFFAGREQTVAYSNSDENIKMLDLTPEAAEMELDNEMTETSQVSTFSVSGHEYKTYVCRTTQQDQNLGKIWRR